MVVSNVFRAKVLRSHAARFVILFLLLFGFASETSAQSHSDPNAIFVEAVLTYREAILLEGSERTAGLRRVRSLFDEILVQHQGSRPAQVIQAGGEPAGVKMALLPPPSLPRGWNDGKREVARRLLADYGGNLSRIHKVADAAHYALIAEAAYGKSELVSKARKAGFGTFPLSSKNRILVGDATATLFKNSDGHTVLAFRGTTQKRDWVTNIGGTLSWTPLLNWQVSDALKIAEAVYRENPNVVFVGHSLGGRLAQVASMKTGQPAFVFNSAPVGLHEIKEMGFSGLVDGKVQRFRSPQDPLSRIFPLLDEEVSNIGEAAFDSGWKQMGAARFMHAMEALVLAMEEVRIARDEGWVLTYLKELKGLKVADLDAQHPKAIEAKALTSENAEQRHTSELLAGLWTQSGEGWSQEYRFEGLGAKVTRGGTEKRPNGTSVLRIASVRDTGFDGQWRFNDGVWRDIHAYYSSGSIEIRHDYKVKRRSRTLKWNLRQTSAGTISAEPSAATKLFSSDVAATRVLQELFSQEPVERHMTCGDMRGPLTSQQMQTLFLHKKLDIVSANRRIKVPNKIINMENIRSNSMWVGEIETSSHSIFLCTGVKYPFVGKRGKWIASKILSVEPLEKNKMGETSVVVVQKIPVSRCGDPTFTEGVNWRGRCSSGRPVGPGQIEWWDDSKLVWKAVVGPQSQASLEDGELRINLDRSKVSFQMAACSGNQSIVRANLSRGLPNDILYFENVIDLIRREGKNFGDRVCGKRSRSGVSIYREGDQKPIIGAGESFTTSNFIRAFKREVRSEGSAIVARIRQARIDEEKNRLRAIFDAKRNSLVLSAKKFTDGAVGNLDLLAVSLELDELNTLKVLDSGVTVELPKVENIESYSRDGERIYRVQYFVSSPLARLEEEHRLIAMRQKFSWDTWLSQSNAVGKSGQTKLSCEYTKLDDIPQKMSRVDLELVSFSKNASSVTISAKCTQ